MHAFFTTIIQRCVFLDNLSDQRKPLDQYLRDRIDFSYVSNQIKTRWHENPVEWIIEWVRFCLCFNHKI